MTYNGPTIFKDAGSNGALPGDSVRMMLDSNALDYGPELVPNGDFSTTDLTGWTDTAANGTVENGKLRVTSQSTTGRFVVSVPVTAGALYEFSGVTEVIDHIGVFRVGNASRGSDYLYVNAASSVKKWIIPTQSTIYISLSTDTANGATYFDNISLRKLIGIHADQPSTALQPVLGRSPKERRNLLTWTEDFTNAVWSKSGVTATASVITPTTADTTHAVYYHSNESGRNALSFVVEPIGYTKVYIGVLYSPNSRGGGFSFDLSGSGSVGEFTGSDVGVLDAKIEWLGGNKYLCSATFENTFEGNFDRWIIAPLPDSQYPTPNLSASAKEPQFVGDGVSGIKVHGSQLEPNDVTPYQKAKSQYDITEEGVPSYTYIRYDHVDDKLPQAYPEAKTGDLLICGRDGSWIDRDVSVAAGGSLSVISGKDSPKTPGIAPALGDIVGSLHAPRTLNDYEIAKLTEYWQERGAKGLLVPDGVELVTNGGFDTDTDWTKGANVTISGGVVNASTGTALVTQNMPVTVGEFHLMTLDYNMTSGSRIRIDTEGSLAIAQSFSLAPNSSGTLYLPFKPTAQIVAIAASSAEYTGTIDNISVQKLVIA